jgi:predicted kinase
MHVLIDRLLERGIAIIVDATNLKDENRRPYYEIADRRGAEVLLVRIWAPARTIRARLSKRTASPDPADRSSANMDVYEAMLKETERIRRPHVSVNASGDLGPALDKVLGLLQS